MLAGSLEVSKALKWWDLIGLYHFTVEKEAKQNQEFGNGEWFSSISPDNL